MKVLVTGGAGFIGANLCRELVGRDEITRVAVLDDLSTGRAENLDGVDVDLTVGSILDRPLLERLARDADSIVHLAARPSVPKSLEDPVATHEVNATGTLYVLEAARPHNTHVIVASSSSVYGDTPTLPKHEDLPTRPLSPYGVSKLATENYALAYGRSFGLPTLAFRFFNVYGPWQAADHAYAAVVPAFLSAALAGRPVTIYGDGRQTRDFTFVGSVVEVLTDAILRKVAIEKAVNLAFGTRTTLLELVDAMQKALGLQVAVAYAPARPGDIRDSQASCEWLAEVFPGGTSASLSSGISITAEWFQRANRHHSRRTE